MNSKSEQLKIIFVLTVVLPLFVPSCTTINKSGGKTVILKEVRPAKTISKAEVLACKNPAGNVTKAPPFYLESHKIFMTAFTNQCPNSNMVEKDSDWAGMRIPCAEEQGKVVEKGTEANPKLVSFNLDTGCAFIPEDKDKFEKGVNEALGLLPTAGSLAINPLSIQYWEVKDSNDADIGADIMLRTQSGLDKYKGWLKGTPLKVDIFGRENAWGSEQHFYYYEVEIVSQPKDRFQVNVLSARELSSDEKEAIGDRCRALQPKRNCHLVF